MSQGGNVIPRVSRPAEKGDPRRKAAMTRTASNLPTHLAPGEDVVAADDRRPNLVSKELTWKHLARAYGRLLEYIVRGCEWDYPAGRNSLLQSQSGEATENIDERDAGFRGDCIY